MDFLTDVLPELIASPWVILVVFAVCIVDGFFPPVPSETTVVAVLAAAVSTGASPWWIATIAAATALGAIAGDSVAYAIGRRVGLDRGPWLRRPAVRRVTGWVSARMRATPAALILVGRYIPGGRVAVNALAGATRVGYGRFLALSALAGASWALMSVAIGALSAAWLGDPLWSAVLGVGIMLALGLALDHVARRRLRDRVSADAGHANRLDQPALVHAPGDPRASASVHAE